jgi:hypothetical protein
LADNGGPTQTHLPMPNSPAINAGHTGSCPATDQRGYLRPIADICDIGAVDVHATDSSATATPTITPTAVPTLTPTPTSTATPKPVTLNYTLFALEVTQGIQDLQNTVPLVRNKTTWVRAHVRRSGGDSSPVISARLWRIVNGARSGNPVYPSNPGGKIAPPTALSRDQLNDSFYFAVPATWLSSPSLQVEVEVNPFTSPNCNVNPIFCPFLWWREATETNYSDNVLRSPVLGLQSVPPLRLWLYNVVYSKRTGNTTNWYQTSNTHLFEIEDWLRRAYPISNLISQRSTTTMPETSIFRWMKDSKNKDVYRMDASLVNQRLNLIRTINQIYNPNFMVQERYYGVVTDAGGFMRGLGGGFIASGPTGNANTSMWGWWDKDSTSYGDWYAGHEIGHTWNRGHPVVGGYVDEKNQGCGHSRDDANYPYPNAVIGGKNTFLSLGPGAWIVLPPSRYYGFDVFLRTPVVYGPDWTDMMSYCDKQWISDYTYNGIRQQIQSEGMVQAAQPLGPAGDYVLIQGEFAIDMASATLDTILKIPSPVGQPLPEPGEFAIHFRGSGGQLLASYPFEPTVYEDDDEEEPRHFIHLALPYPAGVRTIEVRKGNTLLAARTVSPNSPAVQVLAPNGGEVIGPAGVTVSWTMSDADGDPLAASVLFSADNGGSWRVLTANITGTQFTVPFEHLAGTTQGRIRVLVSDGVNTSHDDSDGVFTVQNQAPAAMIVSPEENARFVQGQMVALRATSYDAEDGVMSGEAFTWHSDRDGLLGTGSEVEITILTKGTHLIELTVTDSAGSASKVTRTVVVEEDLTNVTALLAVAPETVQLSAVVGASQPATATLTIRDANAGTGLTTPLTWSATSPTVGWLALATKDGVTPSDLTLSATATGLATGVHSTTLTISAAAVTRSVTVELQVVPAPTDPSIYLPLIMR